MMKEKVAEDVACHKNFDFIREMIKRVNDTSSHIIEVLTYSDYFNEIDELRRFVLKDMIITLRKGLIELYTSEYEDYTRREAEKIKDAKREVLFNEVLKELKK